MLIERETGLYGFRESKEACVLNTNYCAGSLKMKKVEISPQSFILLRSLLSFQHHRAKSWFNVLIVDSFCASVV